jgi:glycosyltransferase involved in cell wall biosynthesis
MLRDVTSELEGQVMEAVLSLDEQRRFFSGHAQKKILFVTRGHEFGGAQRHLIDLIRRLCEPGLQLSILCFGEDVFTDRLPPDLNICVIRRKGMPGSLWGWVSLFRATQPDVVVFIYGWGGAFPWLASVGAWMVGIGRRFSIQHLNSGSAQRGPIRRVVRRILGPVKNKIAARLFHTTICVSKELENSLVKDFGFPAKKMKTIRNGVSLSEFVPSEGNGSGIRAKLLLRPDEFIFVCAARLSEQKGIDILLQAIARVVRDGVCCKCIIVGDGPLREQLWEQAREMGLAGHVFFEGFQEDVRPYLQASSAFVLTSRREGLPLAILEAMASGLPCIVTNVGGNAEAITHQVDGLVVPPGSVDAVADAISYLATHPHERAQMSRMARVKVCEVFDIENTMAEIRRVILS